ncbi:uncharacterized protein LOC135333043 [Halichondria panicea]|uniref:uncharacterized protein LOC135333043 n=1 Tax=Halichondria panicea TaxID=6063 RepID=UPI00312B8CF5
MSPGHPLGTAQQPKVYEVTISTFNDELTPPYHSVPLYCSISPQPDEPLFYRWTHSVNDQYVSATATSPYAFYKPLFNHPRYGRVFCHVETEEGFLGTGSILLEAQGYVEAIGRTAVSLQPTKPLTLRGEVSRQYSTDNKSPLLNTRVLTRWSYNGVPITQQLESDQPTLSFNRTQESDTGEYVLSVSHFYISRGFDKNNETEGNMLGIAGDINRQCSDIVLSTLGLYAIFSPVEFQVNIGTKQIPAEPTKSTHYYEFFEKKQVYVMIQIPLQSIQGIDYNQLSDNFELSYKLLHNGKIIFDTIYRLSSRGYTSRVSEYRLINDSTVEANLTFFSPKATDVGIYEYQFYVRNEDVQRVLDTTQCDTSYQNFLDGGIRLLFFLIGEATIYIKMADQISVNASKYYYSIGDEEGSTLSCTLAQQNSSAQELNWHKNGYQVMTTNSSSILYINISDTVEKLDFVNEYGTYTCTAMETDGRQSSKSIHVAEKAFFSIQLRPENGLDCASVSTEAVKTAVLSELRSTFSQTCNCDITLDEFTMATMLCDDNNMLTLSSDLLFSDQDGELTASSLLSSAASRLAGVRTFNDATLFIDTSCAL